MSAHLFEHRYSIVHLWLQSISLVVHICISILFGIEMCSILTAYPWAFGGWIWLRLRSSGLRRTCRRVGKRSSLAREFCCHTLSSFGFPSSPAGPLWSRPHFLSAYRPLDLLVVWRSLDVWDPSVWTPTVVQMRRHCAAAANDADNFRRPPRPEAPDLVPLREPVRCHRRLPRSWWPRRSPAARPPIERSRAAVFRVKPEAAIVAVVGPSRAKCEKFWMYAEKAVAKMERNLKILSDYAWRSHPSVLSLVGSLVCLFSCALRDEPLCVCLWD